jgi:hypothetical protein
MKERYRLVSLNGEVTLPAIKQCLRQGKMYRHYWQAPVKRFLVRCTIDRHGKHYRVVAVGGPDPMGYVWQPVAHFDMVFISKEK